MLHHSESFDLKSSEIGQVFRIHVAYPYYRLDPRQKFSVVYVLDADIMFGLATSLMVMNPNDEIDPGVSQALIVGIGYDDPTKMGFLRMRDYTPPGSIEPWFAALFEPVHGRAAETGGADAFLSYIENELHSAILSKYPAADGKATLMGHSTGGIFSLYCFSQQIELFDRYWIGGPGILNVECDLVAELPKALERKFDVPTMAYLSLGGRERTYSRGAANGFEKYQEMAKAFDRISRAIYESDQPNLEFEAREFPGETHTSVIPAAMNCAYRFLMRGGGA